MHVRVFACMTGYARNAGFTLAEKTSVKASTSGTRKIEVNEGAGFCLLLALSAALL